METKAVGAKQDLEFLIKSLPDEDPEWTGLKAAFEAAIVWLDKVKDKCVREAHESLSKTAPAGECPCGSCKAERYIEVLQNLTHEQLLQIVASEIAIADTEPCTKRDTDECSKVENVVVYTNKSVE